MMQKIYSHKGGEGPINPSPDVFLYHVCKTQPKVALSSNLPPNPNLKSKHTDTQIYTFTYEQICVMSSSTLKTEFHSMQFPVPKRLDPFLSFTDFQESSC